MNINLADVKIDDLKTGKQLIDAYAKYLMKTLDYDEEDAMDAATWDFKNPYKTEYVVQEHEGDYEYGGKMYEVRYCRTDFCRCGMFHLQDVPCFEFYMLINKETLPDNTVNSYINAEKMYLI